MWWLLLLIPLGWGVIVLPSWRRPVLGLVEDETTRSVHHRGQVSLLGRRLRRDTFSDTV